MSQTYTVLGGTGFIGKHLCHELNIRGAKVWVPMRQDQEIFKRPLGIVFYCIGLTSDYLQRQFDTVHAHVCYFARLLEHAQFDHIVYLSSTRLYDSLPLSVGREDISLNLSPSNPRHLYDLSKALGESLCRTTSANRSSIARISCVYSTETGAPGFLSELLQRLRHERTLSLDSSSSYCRDYITLDDTVNSLIAMGEQRACGTFNVASGKNTYNCEIAEVLRPLGVDISFTRSGESMQMSRCDINNLHHLGITPKETLHTVQTYARNLYK